MTWPSYLFDGVLGAAVVTLAGIAVQRWLKSHDKPTPDHTIPQLKMTDSATAAGFGNTQFVNSPVSVTMPAVSSGTPPDLPDVLLQCEWPDVFHRAGLGPALPPLSGMHEVRNRPWTLRHLGDGAVYNVRVSDISFGKFIAAFGPIDVLTNEVIRICPKIFLSA